MSEAAKLVWLDPSLARSYPHCQRLVRVQSARGILGLLLIALLAVISLLAPRSHLGAQPPTRDTARVASLRDSLARGQAPDSSEVARLLRRAFPSDLDVALSMRFEAKTQRTRNDRCATSVLFRAGFSCRSPFTPSIDALFSLKTTGGFTDRTEVNVDYDSQREFDGSNDILMSYTGRPENWLKRVEVGNVSFTPPQSRFLTAGIPSGNFGVQASAQFGGVTVTAIAAQQKGNVIRDQVFTVGRRTARQEVREIEDYQIEPRRFFFTVDPQLFGARYPNVDLLNGRQMNELALGLPDSLRPSKIFLYRILLGGQPPNPNGPRFQLLGDPLSRAGQVYELLRENLDYYVDPSQLWIALVRPLALNNERLVVAYTLKIGGKDTVIARLGGTPDLEYAGGRDQFAHLLWDPQVTPDTPAFRREIRSVYRIGGSDIRRESVQIQIVAGPNNDQEKPPGGSAASYLQLFGIAQLLNASSFDRDNRLWPRPEDPNFQLSTTTGSVLFRDRFLIFPSLEPFSRRGLAQPAVVPANDTIYRTPSEYIYSPQHPQSFYRIRARYEISEGSSGTIALNALQVRPASERLTMDGIPLVRGVDYDIDYQLGHVTLLTADTLSSQIRRVVVRFEENPLFASVPTSIVGLSSEWAIPYGNMAFTAISQSQRTTFNRPPLGYEPQAGIVAGISANLGWDLGAATPIVPGARLDAMNRTPSPSRPRLDVTAEIAVSQPRQRQSQQAYIQTFEADGGTRINLLDAQWLLSSQPALGQVLRQRVGAAVLDTTRAATMAFQNAGTGRDGKLVQFTIRDIDPQTTLTGIGVAPPEQLLWMTLYPLAVGGKYDATRQRFQWQTQSTLPGRHWRSIRTVLGPAGSGIDLSRGEAIEFWALIDTVAANRPKNPTLVLDLGDVSENSIAIVPESLVVTGADSAFLGRRLEGFDRLDSERDAFSRTFNADVNDVGLAGDIISQLPVNTNGVPSLVAGLATCALSRGRSRILGDNQGNCTARNGRLDEEDIDQDNALNFLGADRELERVRRYIVDLSERSSYSRVGKCGAQVRDVNGAISSGAVLCWVQVRVPFPTPDEITNGGPSLRRIRAARLTMISGAGLTDQQFSMVPIARLRVVGAPWLKRSDRPIHGVGGTESAMTGRVVATVIGTEDRDSTRGIFYEPPPGVVDQADDAGTQFGTQQVQVNERSMRILATDLKFGDRAEAFYRFPEGQRSVMGYRQLRVWARGRGNGWGPSGDLQFFIKLGRDADNFYLYRVSAGQGTTRAAWEPEIRVNFERFFRLRAQLQTALLSNGTRSIGCSGVDSAMIAASGLPPSPVDNRYVACDDGYMVYTADPAISAPNLAAVQELAVGIVRVDSMGGFSPLMPGDTAEVWVDDIRLADVVSEMGVAGELTATLNAGPAGAIRFSARRRDPQFRQLGEAPTFLTNDDVDVSATWQLDRLLPHSYGFALPFTIAHRASLADPEFVTRSDIRGDAVTGLRTPRTHATTVALGARRLTPVDGDWYDALLNRLVFDGTANLTGQRTEFLQNRVSGFQAGLEMIGSPFNAVGDDGEVMGRGLMPRILRLASAAVQSDDRRDAFLRPGAAADDRFTRTAGAERLWRSSGAVEFQPLPAMTARFDMLAVQDMRSYADVSPSADAAQRERGSLLGLDVGLERERTMTTSINIAPPQSGWFRPRIALGSTYSMLRDPNNRSLFLNLPLDGDTLDRLPRRTGNTQFVTLATTMDARSAVASLFGEASTWTRGAGLLRPVEFSYSRNQLSAYDGVPVAPGVGFQFGVGRIDGFKGIDGFSASNAGLSNDAVLATALALPAGASLTTRLQWTESSHWNRRAGRETTRIDGQQFVRPDIAFRWSGAPRLLSGMFSSMGLSARMLRARQQWTVPSQTQGRSGDFRLSRQSSFPISATLVTAWGDVALSGTYARSQRVDSLPGSAARGQSREVQGDISKTFPLPRAWGMSSPLRTRLSYQETGAENFVSNAAAFGARSRLTDNGRRAVNLNLDADVDQNMTLSLQSSRVETFDRNFNRRVVQTIITAVFQMQFFSGPGG